jgi:hypothetical protein
MICPRQWEGDVTFPAVDANLITDRLTIRISSIDGIPAEDAARQKRISVMPETEYRQSINPQWIGRPSVVNVNETFFTIDRNGKLTGYSGPGGDVVIPCTVIEIPQKMFDGLEGKKLTSVIIPNSVRIIGEKAFRFNRLTNVVIPNGVKIIGEKAFSHNELTDVAIPDSVRTIGTEAFADNQLSQVTISNSVTRIRYLTFSDNKLTSVTIPNSVTNIEWSAFTRNQLTSITIGADVSIDPKIGEAFDNKFRSFYDKNGKKAGVYTYRRNNWSYSPQ